MNEVPLHHVHTYTDVDRAFWAEHLEDWVPRRIIDAHVHIVHPRYQIETLTEEMRHGYWVNELLDMQDAETAERCYHTVYPGREVSCVAFGFPGLGWDIEGANLYVSTEMAKRNCHALAVVRPTWVAEQIAWWLDQPAVIGVKPYYTLIGYDRTTRDRYIEASIFEFLPHHQLEVLDARAAWVTLHVPKADRLGHPDNIREVQEIRRRYPRIKVVIAHLGRSYTLPHAQEGLAPLAEDPGLYFDNSAVLNPAVHRYALETIGPERILYGTDNPIFYLRGRRQWHGRTYVNRCSHPFHFNKERESPEIEAKYTLYMYEALKALKDACAELGLGSAAVEAMLHGNASCLIDATSPSRLREKDPSDHGKETAT
ncbi:MAG: amidohydrolase family protein [Candidatus Hydrogenedentes bacterium]|nr:amidohydrolase family protein [Candidatus Hydrogenedentota bacterium]